MPRNMRHYRQSAKTSAPPEQRVVMVYEAIGQNLEHALACLQAGASAHDPAGISSISLAGQLIRTLKQALDEQQGGHFARHMEHMYDHWLDLLARGEREREAKPVREVQAMVENMKKTWCESARQEATHRYGKRIAQVSTLEHHPEKPMDVWHAGSLNVFYYPSLDGAGTDLAPAFISYIRMFCPDHTFQHAFEWCAGPGFIGFSLLEAGLCSKLCLGDINPEAVRCARATVRENGLAHNVSVFESDNFKAVPADLRFDLVVANPPNYCHLNDEHPWGHVLSGTLRPHDPDWKVHRAFYRSVAAYLEPGGLLFIAEVEPFKRQVHIPASEKEPYDERERPPIEAFAEMIEEANLSLLDVGRFVEYEDAAAYWMLTIEKPA